MKQIVGGSLSDEEDYARENYVSDMQAADYAALYRKKGLRGGHIILLNSKDSKFYEADLEQARGALSEWPEALQIGGGVTAENARQFIEMGASHVIVTSYVFSDGLIRYNRLQKLADAVGKEHLVLDVSCRKREEQYFIVTDRWQKFTKQPLEKELFRKLSRYCDEFLVHAVNVEGTGMGVDEELLTLLADETEVPITYAGGIGSMADIEKIKNIGRGSVNFTVGSALDLFGGPLKLDEIVTKF